MLSKHFVHHATYILMLGFMTNIMAQNKPAELSQIKLLYEELRFEEATKIGQKLLSEGDFLSAHQLEFIHQYLAFSFYNIGEFDSARVHFLTLLTISPEKEFDPLSTSPKIINFFNQIKETFLEVNNKSNTLSYPRYIFIEDKRPGAAWRSALFPGWGQFYKGQKSRTYLYGGGFITSTIIFSLAAINENNYEQKYLESIQSDDIRNNYDKFNSWSKVRRISAYSAMSIWLLSFLDALWTGYHQLELTPNQNFDSVALTIQYNF